MIKRGCVSVLAGFPCRMSVFIWIMVFGGLLAGCAGRQSAPGKKDISPEAETLLERLSGQNVTPICFKGYGKYRMVLPNGKLSGRMAWAVTQPDQFRVEILDVTGRPFTTMASDGQWLYVHLKAERQFNKKPYTKSTFKRIIGTAVTVRDMIIFLSGRVPVHAHQKAQVRPGRESDGEKGPILVLRGKWNRLVEKVYFDKDALVPLRVVIYSNSGAFSYQVDIGAPFPVRGYTFFRKLVFQNRRRNGLKITVEKLWPNVELAPSIFKLQNPYL